MGKWREVGRLETKVIPLTPCLGCCCVGLQLPGQHPFLQDTSSVLLLTFIIPPESVPLLDKVTHKDTSEAIDLLCHLIHAALSVVTSVLHGLAGLAFIPHAWASQCFHV